MTSAGRRRLVIAAGASALLHGCGGWTPAPPLPPLAADSPLRRGPHKVGRAVLGATPGTAMLPVPEAAAAFSFNNCQGMPPKTSPAEIPSMVYYPAMEDSEDLQRRIDFWIAPRIAPGSLFHPLVLYAHARHAGVSCAGQMPPPFDDSYADERLDFRRIDTMLSHLASHGCVVVAPDLGFLSLTTGSFEWSGDVGPPRAMILVALAQQLSSNRAIFGELVDPDRLGLVGHSTGAEAVLSAFTRMPFAKFLGLVAPAMRNVPPLSQPPATAFTDPVGTLVIDGELDPTGPQSATRAAIFNGAPMPKALATLGGANHGGYTELCTPDNQHCLLDPDGPGTARRVVQAEIGGALLAAGMRTFLLRERHMWQFLDGSRDIGAAPFLHPVGAGIPPLALQALGVLPPVLP